MIGSLELERFFERRRFALKPGIERIRSLLDRLGNPEKSYTSIHVAGTNGKGSTAAFISSMLQKAGYCTGLFTSPHLVSYTERFRVDGVDILPEQLAGFLAKLLEYADSDETFFEITTALACCYFADKGVRIAVLEAGMGGINDATAAIAGIATIITPVALDHCQWLGNELQAIANEKVGIARPGSMVICAEQVPEVLSVIEEHCRLNNNRLVLAGRDFHAVYEDMKGISYCSNNGKIGGLYPGLKGSYQTGNLALAIAAAEQLAKAGFTVDRNAVSTGLADVRWPGRMEQITLSDGTELLIDGAHNPAGSQALARNLDEMGRTDIILVTGMMEDKDIAGILMPLLKRVNRVITVNLAQERAISDKRLADVCKNLGSPADYAGTVSSGLEVARKMVTSGGLILAAGSLFLVGELKALLAGVPFNAVRG